MARTRKVKASGKHKVGYGTNVRTKFIKVESKQRKKQNSPFHPTGKAKRISAGIWKCLKTGRIFAGKAYYLENK